MGIIRSSFWFFTGTVAGVYVAQNYNVPSIKKLIDDYMNKAKTVEQTHRKPNKPGED